jgi:hypothetical protein
MATSPIYNWPEPDNTDLVKNGALAIRTLGNAIDTTMGTMVAKTVVDAKGDLIAGTAADTVNRLAVGNNGETLVADSSTSVGIRYQTGVNLNGIINGAMDIWQRGTSFATTGNISYTADRWAMFRSATGMTVSRQAAALEGFQYSARVQRDSGTTATNTNYLFYSMETNDSVRYANKAVTLSFWAKAGANYSSASSVLNVNLQTGTGTDQIIINGYTGANSIITATSTLTTSWQRFQYTATAPSNTNEMGLIFSNAPVGTAGANDWFEVTGVQIEFGSIATNFKRAGGGTIQGELSACQRYYETRNNSIWSGNTTSGSNYYLDIPFAVVKRGTPTITLVTTGINGFPSISAASINTSSYRITGTANATGSGCFLAADLWTASAEL